MSDILGKKQNESRFAIKGFGRAIGITNCDDSTGDEDGCCEFGSSFQDFISITAKDLIKAS